MTSRQPQILVADDDRTVRTVIFHALSKQGYQVGVTSSVAGLWDMSTAGRGDVLITDVSFPDGDALDLLPRLREKRHDLVIIVMSAHANLLTAIKTQQTGVFDYLPKPFELRQLLDVTARAVREDRTNVPAANQPIAGLPKQIPAPLIGKSPAMQMTFKLLGRIAAQSVPGLIKAELGSGKQIVAQTLHEMSHLSSAPFEAIDLSQIEDAQQTELLFGARGLVTHTSVGSLFLNNIEQLCVPAQKTLAQFIVARTSGDSHRKVPLGQLRLICGTSSDLKVQVSRGAFREDLYFEFTMAELEIPPLRERQEDIPQLANWFCSQLNNQFNTERQLDTQAIVCLQNHTWPGNVREFEVLLKRLFIATTERQISERMVQKELGKLSLVPDQQPAHERTDAADNLSQVVQAHLAGYFEALDGTVPDSGLYSTIVAEVERPLIIATLQHTAGNQIKAANILGLNRNTLRKKIRELKISTNRNEYR